MYIWLERRFLESKQGSLEPRIFFSGEPTVDYDFVKENFGLEDDPDEMVTFWWLFNQSKILAEKFPDKYLS
jgi:hypothetical protein